MKTHKKQIYCEFCSEVFESKHSVEEHTARCHTQNENKQKIILEEWNCDNCPFQANCASELLKHLQVSGHQPSKNVRDKRKVFENYKQCYTCKMDFDGFYNLMNHRKVVHPSNKKCRNFSIGKCTFGAECWYVHGEETEDSSDKFKCNLCDDELKGRNSFMLHKKLLHPQNVPPCEKFREKNCSRSSKDCWFDHEAVGNNRNENPWPKLVPNSPRKTEEPVFRGVPAQTMPPDQMKMMIEMMSSLCDKVENMEKRLNNLIN